MVRSAWPATRAMNPMTMKRVFPLSEGKNFDSRRYSIKLAASAILNCGLWLTMKA